MTIDELLALARQNVKQASRAHDATSAAIAQAASTTAQAMMMHSRAEAAEVEVHRLREQVRVLRIAVQEAYNYLDEQVGDDVESELYITFAVVREAWYAVRDTPA